MSCIWHVFCLHGCVYTYSCLVPAHGSQKIPYNLELQIVVSHLIVGDPNLFSIYLFLCYYFKRFIYLYIMCMSILLAFMWVYHVHAVPMEAIREDIVFLAAGVYKWSWVAMWVLGTEPESSVRASSAVNYQVFHSPALKQGLVLCSGFFTVGWSWCFAPCLGPLSCLPVSLMVLCKWVFLVAQASISHLWNPVHRQKVFSSFLPFFTGNVTFGLYF